MLVLYEIVFKGSKNNPLMTYAEMEEKFGKDLDFSYTGKSYQQVTNHYLCDDLVYLGQLQMTASTVFENDKLTILTYTKDNGLKTLVIYRSHVSPYDREVISNGVISLLNTSEAPVYDSKEDKNLSNTTCTTPTNLLNEFTLVDYKLGASSDKVLFVNRKDATRFSACQIISWANLCFIPLGKLQEMSNHFRQKEYDKVLTDWLNFTKTLDPTDPKNDRLTISLVPLVDMEYMVALDEDLDSSALELLDNVTWLKEEWELQDKLAYEAEVIQLHRMRERNKGK